MQFRQPVSKKSKFKLMSSIALCSVLFLSACEYVDLKGKFTPKSEDSFLSKKMPKNKEDQAKAYANTTQNMSGAMGLSNRAYLTEEVQDSIFRLAKLHQTVSDIQNRMNVVSPSMEQLEMMKSEINELGKKFDHIQMTLRQAPQHTDTMTSNDMAQNPIDWANHTAVGRPMNIIKADPAMNNAAHKPRTMHKPAIAKSYSPAPASFASQIPTGTTGLVDIRIGEHKNKTRLVLDLAQATDIRYDLDNEQNILVVELPGAAANNLKSKTFKKSPLLKGYDVQQSGDNTLVIFMFKKATHIAENMQLKGTSKSATRYVFDMAK
jgi:hypothetical protein